MSVSDVKVVGLGLVGGSLARLWSDAGIRLWGWDTNPQTRHMASEVGIEIPSGYSEWLKVPANLTVVATPIDKIGGVFSDLAKHVRDGQVVADIGSVKEWPARWALRSDIFQSYVGLHPMAGLAASGFQSSDPSVYQNVPWVLVPGGASEQSNCDVASFLCQTTHARLLVTDAKTHDSAAALVSHLPHVIANSLLSNVADAACGPLAFAMAAGSFRDVTRVAGVDSNRTANMLEWNSGSVAAAIGAFVQHLMDVSVDLRQEVSTLGFLDRAEKAKQQLEMRDIPSDVWLPDGTVCEELARLTATGQVVTSIEQRQEGWQVSLA